jgi:hypothetical protein
MTITTTQLRKQYDGNDVTTVFAYNYRFDEDSDIVVKLTNNAGATQVQILNTDYTLTGAGGDSGGNVTMTTAPATGEILTIYRSMDLIQEDDFQNQENIYPEAFEDGLDYQMMVIQQINEELGRCVKSDIVDNETGLTASTIEDYIDTKVAESVDASIQVVTNLAADVAAAGSLDTTLTIIDEQVISADLSIPKNITLSVTKSGIIKDDGNGRTLTVLGDIIKVDYQIFNVATMLVDLSNMRGYANAFWAGYDLKNIVSCKPREIYIPPYKEFSEFPSYAIGDLYISETCDMGANNVKTIWGKGFHSVVFSTISDGSNIFHWDNAEGSFLIAEDFRIDGNSRQDGNGIDLAVASANVKFIRLRNLWMYDVGGHDIYLGRDVTGTPQPYEIDIEGCYFRKDYTSEGTADGTTASKLVDSTADFVTDGVVAGMTVWNVTDNTSTTVTAVDDANTLALSDDIFVSGEAYKVSVSKANIYCDNPNQVRIHGNRIWGKGYAGVYVNRTTRSIRITENSIEVPGGYGIRFKGTSDHRGAWVSRNHLENCGIGIAAVKLKASTIKENEFRTCYQAITIDNRCDHLKLARNDYSGNTSDIQFGGALAEYNTYVLTEGQDSYITPTFSSIYPTQQYSNTSAKAVLSKEVFSGRGTTQPSQKFRDIGVKEDAVDDTYFDIIDLVSDAGVNTKTRHGVLAGTITLVMTGNYFDGANSGPCSKVETFHVLITKWKDQTLSFENASSGSAEKDPGGKSPTFTLQISGATAIAGTIQAKATFTDFETVDISYEYDLTQICSFEGEVIYPIIA